MLVSVRNADQISFFPIILLEHARYNQFPSERTLKLK